MKFKAVHLLAARALFHRAGVDQYVALLFEDEVAKQLAAGMVVVVRVLPEDQWTAEAIYPNPPYKPCPPEPSE